MKKVIFKRFSFKLFLYCIYILLIILISKFTCFSNHVAKNCLSLILPSTEEDFLRCYKQFFYSSESFISAKEIVVAISSVSNETYINEIINRLSIKNKIKLGLRKGKHNAASNRNYGYMLSTCNIISYFDMDDIMAKNRLNAIYKVFNNDKTVEFLLHKYSTQCEVNNNLDDKTFIQIKYNISYRYIFEMYIKNHKKDVSTNRFCCKYIKSIKKELFHNGWPTMRRYIMNKIKYNISYNSGQDSDFNTNVILNGYNVSLLNLSLGYYKKDNACKNYKYCWN